MATFTHIHLKMDGMRKPQSFLLYPYDGSDTIILQSDTRIMRLNLRTGDATLSKSHPNGSYAPDLMESLGAYPVTVGAEQLATIQAYLWNNSGLQDQHSCIAIENRPLFEKGRAQ